mmetsp:Transcript_86286/g.233939  ORF Transcript_86286/g.233939 Transcript_86286/m.233939 type:complete len:224 (-) Transcript_86286:661-1332(-)
MIQLMRNDAEFSPLVPNLGGPAAQSSEKVGRALSASNDGLLARRHSWLLSAIQEMRVHFNRLYQERSISGCPLSVRDVRNLAECAVGVDPLSGTVFLTRPIDNCMVAIPEKCELAWCCLTHVMSEEEWSREARKILSVIGQRQVQSFIPQNAAREGSIKPLGRRSSDVTPRGQRRSVMLAGSMRHFVSRLSCRSCSQVVPETSEAVLRGKTLNPKAFVYRLSG